MISQLNNIQPTELGALGLLVIVLNANNNILLISNSTWLVWFVWSPTESSLLLCGLAVSKLQFSSCCEITIDPSTASHFIVPMLIERALPVFPPK